MIGSVSSMDSMEIDEMKIDGRKVVAVSCNLCGSEQRTLLWVKDGFQYHRCQGCGLVYISPRLTEAEIASIYAVGFESKSSQRPPPVDYSSYRPFFKAAEKYRRNNTLLDVGCFRGYLLLGARKRGWQVWGTEISRQAADSARLEYGLDVYVGSLLDAQYPSNHFDVVSLFDVVEHLTDPLNYLREIRRILRPGGLLYLDTPNFDSLVRSLLGREWSIFFPWHLHYFTADTMRGMIDEAGLDVVSCRCENWGPISRYNPYRALKSLSAISKPNVASKGWVRRYRKYLKPPYLLARRLTNLPIEILSAFGLYIGSKLIVLAEKPERGEGQ